MIATTQECGGKDWAAIGISWSETRDAVNILQYTGQLLTGMYYLAQNGNSHQVEKLWLR